MSLTASRLSLSYNDIPIFRNLSLDLSGGEILAIKGDNGSGKTSLCLMLCGLIDSQKQGVFCSGSVYYDGKPLDSLSISQRCAAVGIIFQDPDSQLFSPLVIEEAAFAPENLALPRHEIIRRVDEALLQCGISHLKNARTNELSGGEKQLVAIASVLAMQPKILIADEITSRIDMQKKDAVRSILKDFAAKGGSVIMVSHNPSDIAVAHRVIQLKRGKDYEDRA